MYLSPLVTSELFRGLKRHITLMVHSAGSAIFSGLRMEIHRHKLKYILDPRSGRWGRKGRPSPSVPISGSEKRGDYLSGSQQKSLFCFSIASPLLLGSHDTGGSAAGHLTPPAAVDVVRGDVSPALPSSLCSVVLMKNLKSSVSISETSHRPQIRSRSHSQDIQLDFFSEWEKLKMYSSTSG